MNDKMFAELVGNIKQAGHISRMRKMPASEGRALDWTKAQKVIFPNLKAQPSQADRNYTKPEKFLDFSTPSVGSAGPSRPLSPIRKAAAR